MMKLTYRGVNYKTQEPNLKSAQFDRPENRQERQNNHRVMLVRPIHYYTYRGVSYTKNLIFDNHPKNLLEDK